METNTYLIPTWAVCHLAYGDLDGLSDEDLGRLEEFDVRLGNECGTNYIVNFQLDEDPGFYHSNDLDNKGSNCVVMEVTYFPEDKGENNE